MNIRFKALVCLLPLFGLSAIGFSAIGLGAVPAAAQQSNWLPVLDGFEMLQYDLGESSFFIKSEVVLLRFDPAKYRFTLAHAEQLGEKKADVASFLPPGAGVAVVNAHFFGKQGETLGLYLDRREQPGKQPRSDLQSVGSLLTGIFVMRGQRAAIIHRGRYEAADDIDLAIQAGPRLIADGEKLQLKSPKKRSRRSGIAVDAEGRVIIFCTLLRFPGASLDKIQKMLLSPTVGAVNALNLDGGGSSQLYVPATGSLEKAISISGGDKVPSALIVKSLN